VDSSRPEHRENVICVLLQLYAAVSKPTAFFELVTIYSEGVCMCTGPPPPQAPPKRFCRPCPPPHQRKLQQTIPAIRWRRRWTGGRARVRTINPPPRKGLRNDPENFVFNYRHRRKLTTYLISSSTSSSSSSLPLPPPTGPSPSPYSPFPVFLNMISRVQWTEITAAVVSACTYIYTGTTVLYYAIAVPRVGDGSCRDIWHAPHTHTHTIGTLSVHVHA